MVSKCNKLSLLYAQRKDIDEQMVRLRLDGVTSSFRQILLSLMETSNKVDLEIIHLEYMERMKDINKDVNWESDANKYAEGHRQFLINQFEALTGRKIHYGN